MKYVMFTVGWEVRYNMRDAALKCFDYFVDNAVTWQNKIFMGKPIKSPEILRSEDLNNTIVIVGSLSHRAIISQQLNKMGYTENKNFFWAPNWHGDAVLPPLYYEKNRWPDLFRKNIGLIDSWYFKDRAKIISGFVNWDDCHSVLDLGSGAMLIRKYLASHTNYFPVDFIPYAPEVAVCNLDNHEFPVFDNSTLTIDYVILSGTIELVRDWKWLLNKSGEVSHRILISIVTMEIMAEVKARADHGFVTHIYSHELILYMQEIGFRLTKATERKGLDNIYLFERFS